MCEKLPIWPLIRIQNCSLEWLIDEDEDKDFVALCPDEIEDSLPDGNMSYTSSSGGGAQIRVNKNKSRIVPQSSLIKNSERIVKLTTVGRVSFQDKLMIRLKALARPGFESCNASYVETIGSITND